jgi:hypothetical protein
VWLEGLGQLKKSTSLGHKPETFRLVARYLNQVCYRVPRIDAAACYILAINILGFHSLNEKNLCDEEIKLVDYVSQNNDTINWYSNRSLEYQYLAPIMYDIDGHDFLLKTIEANLKKKRVYISQSTH